MWIMQQDSNFKNKSKPTKWGKFSVQPKSVSRSKPCRRVVAASEVNIQKPLSITEMKQFAMEKWTNSCIEHKTLPIMGNCFGTNIAAKVVRPVM